MEVNKNIFKANDIRGIYPSEINEKVVLEIVFAIKNIFFTKGKSAPGGKCLIVVGHDARLSSPSLYRAVLTALKENKKLKIIEVGLMTTPAIYFLVNKLKADGGIIVTASHNPKEYNGLKIIGKKAIPVSGKEILACLFTSSLPIDGRARFIHGLLGETRPRSFARGGFGQRRKYALNLYATFLKKHLKVSRKLRIVIDCSSGVAGLVIKELLKNNKKIVPIFLNEKPDGNFPAHSPNPLVSGSLDQIKKEVLRQRADLGIIFDGDGDRVFFIDNLSREIDPDVVGYILTNKYRAPYVVSTISSKRVKDVAGAVVAKVGHLFMKEMMRKKKASLGMERSGHYYFKKFFYCDSGVLAALEIINFVGRLSFNFSSYIDLLPRYYQSPELNFNLPSNKNNKNLEKKIEKIEKFYKSSAKKINKKDGLLVEAGDWWFSLRLSNSENLLRLNLEANSQKILDQKLIELKNFILK